MMCVNLQWLLVKLYIPCKDKCRTLLLLVCHHMLVGPPLADPIHNQHTIWNNNSKSWCCARFCCALRVNFCLYSMHWAVKDHSIAVPLVDPLLETCLFHPFQSTKKYKATMMCGNLLCIPCKLLQIKVPLVCQERRALGMIKNRIT